MDQHEFREAIEQLGLSQIQAADFLGVTERTARRWATDSKGIPHAVAIALSLMIKFNITPQQALEIAKRDHWYTPAKPVD